MCITEYIKLIIRIITHLYHNPKKFTQLISKPQMLKLLYPAFNFKNVRLSESQWNNLRDKLYVWLTTLLAALLKTRKYLIFTPSPKAKCIKNHSEAEIHGEENEYFSHAILSSKEFHKEFPFHIIFPQCNGFVAMFWSLGFTAGKELSCILWSLPSSSCFFFKE